MANHKSAKKRFRQTNKKYQINRTLLSKVKTFSNQLNSNITEKKLEAALESHKLFNSALSKAVKRGIIKKNNASRKLSSYIMSIKKLA